MHDAPLQRLTNLTLELCRVASVIGDEKALCDRMEAWCGRYFPGKVTRVSNSLVAGNLDDPRPTIALVGHLDTVPEHPGDALPKADKERVTGLGASDMKGGLAVAMTLVEDHQLARLPWNLVLVFYEREEGPYAENGLEPLLNAVPGLSKVQLAFCMEPTDNEVQVGCVGGLHASVEFKGRSAHSARPWQGENAIHKAAPFLTRLAALERRRVEVDGFEFFEVTSATIASGGRARNVIPEAFTLNVNYRFAPGKSLETAEEELRALVGGEAQVTITDRSPSGRVCSDNAHLKRFRELTGATATSKQAWTDVARLGARGIDAVNFGPGLTAQAHQKGEYVPVMNLGESYRMLKLFLTEQA